MVSESRRNIPLLDTAMVYLAPSTLLEPLVCGWHAFHHLVSPVQAALNLVNRQLPLLESFVRAPAPHIQASSDPLLYGGAFVDLAEDDVPAVKALIADTRSRAQPWLQLATDLRKINADLRAVAKGSSIDHLYAKLPPSLQGVVEYSYDVNNDAHFRVREALLYAGPLRGRELQEIILRPAGAMRSRKFFLNTPRLEGSDALVLGMPFDDRAVDMLVRSRIVPTDLETLALAFGVAPAGRACLAGFFTTEAPRRLAPDHAEADVRVRCFGHACMLIQTQRVSILIDPTFAFERDDQMATLTFNDLPDHIDYVVISHAHQDHFCLESLLQLRPRIGQILVPRNKAGSVADPSMKLALARLGFANVVAMDELDEIICPDGRIISLPFPGEHSELDIFSKQGVAVSLLGRTLVFLVDSDAVDPVLYRRLVEHLPNVDALFIGMECHGAPLTWLYGPLLLRPVSRADDQTRRGRGSDSDRAWAVVEALRPRQTYVYAMGLEPWNRHLLGLEYAADSIQMIESDNFVARCRAAGLPSERLSGCRELRF